MLGMGFSPIVSQSCRRRDHIFKIKIFGFFGFAINLILSKDADEKVRSEKQIGFWWFIHSPSKGTIQK
jgi:hypothetical protein